MRFHFRSETIREISLRSQCQFGKQQQKIKKIFAIKNSYIEIRIKLERN
jgi:hypothetical protein